MAGSLTRCELSPSCSCLHTSCMSDRAHSYSTATIFFITWIRVRTRIPNLSLHCKFVLRYCFFQMDSYRPRNVISNRWYGVFEYLLRRNLSPIYCHFTQCCKFIKTFFLSRAHGTYANELFTFMPAKFLDYESKVVCGTRRGSAAPNLTVSRYCNRTGQTSAKKTAIDIQENCAPETTLNFKSESRN